MDRRYSEFEVQAEAYFNLRNVFRYVKGEYKIQRCDGLRGARLDLAIFDLQGNIALIIEVKKSPIAKTISQGERYSQLCKAPFMYIRGISEARSADKIAIHFLKRISKFSESLLLDI